jgi:phosphosulfolactate synthase (CoM biosynthesis protein A)
MAISFEQFMEATGAEICAGNIIIGIMADRRIIGRLESDGVFSLTDEGKTMADEIQENSPKKSRKKAEDTPAETVEEIPTFLK